MVDRPVASGTVGWVRVGLGSALLAVLSFVPGVARAAAEAERYTDPFPSALYVERDVEVAARGSGVIEKVLVDRGGKVRAGQALAVLETELATRDLEVAQDELRRAEAELQRIQPLAGSGIVSQQELQQREIDRDVAATRVKRARAVLDRCTVEAPFAGVIAERWAVVGQRVEEDDNTPLFRLVASGPLRARVDLPESLLAGVRRGGRATIQLEQSAGETHPARVVFVSPAVDAASGTAPVIVEIAAAGGQLRPGASVTVRLELAGTEPAEAKGGR